MIQLASSWKHLLQTKNTRILPMMRWSLCPISAIFLTSEGGLKYRLCYILKFHCVHFVEVGIYCSFNLSWSLLAKCTIKFKYLMEIWVAYSTNLSVLSIELKFSQRSCIIWVFRDFSIVPNGVLSTTQTTIHHLAIQDKIWLGDTLF